MRSRNWLNTGPFSCRCSLLMPPRVLSNADIEPFLPSAATRTSSKAAILVAASMACKIELSSSVELSCAVMAHPYHVTHGRAKLARLKCYVCNAIKQRQQNTFALAINRVRRELGQQALQKRLAHAQQGQPTLCGQPQYRLRSARR